MVSANSDVNCGLHPVLFDRSQTVCTVRALSKPVFGSEGFTAFEKTDDNQRVNAAVALKDVRPS